jgi:thiamine-phosphate pyrophosphorylase
VDRTVLLQAVAEEKAPVFAIGGIGQENLGQLLEAGVRRVCVCGALLGAPDPRAAAERIRAMIEKTNDGRYG